MIHPEEIHKKLLDMVIQFHSFCEQEGIRYYTLGGTSLGAYRHNGFIPWDDDIDIGIPREDYERLLSLENKLPQNLEIKHYKHSPNHPYNFAKLIDAGTTLIEKDYINCVTGLFIDVFPLDGACSNYIIEKIRQKRLRFWHSAVMCHYSTTPKKGILKKAFKKCAELSNARFLHGRVDRILKKYSWEDSAIIANYLGSWHEKETMEKDIFGEPTLHIFESTELFCQERLSDYLEKLYGDYKQLPPKEEQVFRHPYYYLDLYSSYHDYVR